MLDGEPFKAFVAKKMVAEIIATGTVVFGTHSLDEMRKDGLAVSDCHNLLRAGIFGEAEWEKGEWRYRVQTPRMVFVFAFASETEIRIVTAWRKNR